MSAIYDEDFDNDVKLTLEFIHETSSACLFNTGNKRVWLPTSQLGIEAENLIPGHTYEVTLPEWLAYKKGLI